MVTTRHAAAAHWLASRSGSSSAPAKGNNLAWTGLAKLEIVARFQQAQEPSPEQMIQGLGQLLAEFFEYRHANGITKIFHEYAKWLLRKSWVHGTAAPIETIVILLCYFAFFTAKLPSAFFVSLCGHSAFFSCGGASSTSQRIL
jgi:hypothetical protein